VDLELDLAIDRWKNLPLVQGDRCSPAETTNRAGKCLHSSLCCAAVLYAYSCRCPAGSVAPRRLPACLPACLRAATASRPGPRGGCACPLSCGCACPLSPCRRRSCILALPLRSPLEAWEPMRAKFRRQSARCGGSLLVGAVAGGRARGPARRAARGAPLGGAGGAGQGRALEGFATFCQRMDLRQSEKTRGKYLSHTASQNKSNTYYCRQCEFSRLKLCT
jgi:hypothetical protein